MTFILSLFSDFWPYLAGAVAALAGLWGYGSSKKRQGRNEAINEANEDSLERQEAGRNAVKDIHGSDRGELVDSVRRNEGRWK